MTTQVTTQAQSIAGSRSPRLHRSRMTFAAIAATLVLTTLACSEAAAQTRPNPSDDPMVGLRANPQPGTDPRFQAPIGHRQPRPQDLPPAVRHDENRTSGGTDQELDRKLRICRGC
jgi:hypothetical protein